MLKFNWETDWSAAQAIARLCIDPATYRKPGSHLAQRVEQVLGSALDGATARLNEDQDLGEGRAEIKRAVEAVAAEMKRLQLQRDKKMPPVLWLRLFLGQGVAVKAVAIRNFGVWRLNAERSGAVVYVDCDAERTGSLKIKGLGSAEKIRAWTIEELQWLKRSPKSAWPFHGQWEMRVLERQREDAGGSDASVSDADDRQQELPKKRRRRKKTLADFEKQCGRLVMKALAAVLADESQSRRGLVAVEGEQRYSSELSADALLDALEGSPKFKGRLHGSRSTLRKALGAYVQLKRGRPRVDDDEPLPQPVPKKQR
ncbi:hypothetical protein [Comamonas aquatica]|uniref:Uncharacterized protein n=1 Tax=Comamonas aquatica TaxID=225991 RepID=A0AA35GFR1_9BURK|nr:hypothetical protein [Comamonas aquatica]CAB5681611.1 Uncharacterised protein [Comamonas aquatica]CAC9688095.1 Uncharacterised protein [Comamonas aquatica]